jgi:hypothetical protein
MGQSTLFYKAKYSILVIYINNQLHYYCFSSIDQLVKQDGGVRRRKRPAWTGLSGGRAFRQSNLQFVF